MKENNSIQLKAAFLLIVFALNSLIGFPYTLHADNDLFESQQANQEIHKNSTRVYVNDIKYHAFEVLNENPEQENCCEGNIAKNFSFSKWNSHRTKAATNNHRISVIISCPSTILYKRISGYFQDDIIQFFHLPTTNIRLLIGSFQI